MTFPTEKKTSMRPRILVLLATYNGQDSLSEQLQSILDQKEVDVDVFAGDDCSSDGTHNLLHEISVRERRVKYIRWNKSSGSAGENFRRLFINANLSGYDFVALADQDDIWLSDKLNRAVDALHDSGADGYSAAVEAFWDDGRTRILRQSNIMRKGDFLLEGAGQGCTFVLPVTTFRKVQLFCIENTEVVSKMHYHDWLIYLLVRNWGGRWYFDQSPVMRYRQHANNEIGSRGSIAAFQYRIEKVKNGWYRNQILCAIRIYDLCALKNPDLVTFTENFSRNVTSFRRLKIAAFLLAHGRRKLSERMFLAFCAFLGWI
ncbi:glycosyltransferase [Janthinobacterium sp. SUN128]|uniref:glycosyltransferase n=1 Tax=Janthinobacterium sp. SUN128 TaxID=3014790 RepID=UPI00271308A6|nr:glycosyltransferase [Janthinobacterium sp. SUN128]MDO8035556.1 glycosyltransferase [Janthinobacterium sp. SUN128]